MAALLYFCVVFGRRSPFNAYGSFMSQATIVSGFRGNHRISKTLRLVYILLTVGFATIAMLLGQHSFLKDFLGIHPVPAGVFHTVERHQSGVWTST